MIATKLVQPSLQKSRQTKLNNKFTSNRPSSHSFVLRSATSFNIFVFRWFYFIQSKKKMYKKRRLIRTLITIWINIQSKRLCVIVVAVSVCYCCCRCCWSLSIKTDLFIKYERIIQVDLCVHFCCCWPNREKNLSHW